jgi:hypothetical protein
MAAPSYSIVRWFKVHHHTDATIGKKPLYPEIFSAKTEITKKDLPCLNATLVSACLKSSSRKAPLRWPQRNGFALRSQIRAQLECPMKTPQCLQQSNHVLFPATGRLADVDRANFMNKVA